MRFQHVISVFACICLITASASADVVNFKNGDTLTGKITEISGAAVVFNTEHLGQLTVDANNIAALSADKLVLKNSDTLSGTLQSVTGGKITFQSALLGILTLDMAAIDSFSTDAPAGDAIPQIPDPNAPPAVEPVKVDAPTEPEEPNKPDKTNWDGHITAGVSSSHGNTVKDSYNFSALMVRRSVDDRWTIDADYARARQKDATTGKKVTVEDWWRTGAKYDYFITKKFYLYGTGRYEKDAIARLDRRVILGGGGGYQWIESQNMNFRTEAGIASLYEKFDDQTDSDSKISAQLGYHFDAKVYKNISFIHDLTYYPSFQQPADYFLTTSAELRATLIDQLFANFKVIFDYDTSPAATAQSTDIKYIFGLGYEF